MELEFLSKYHPWSNLLLEMAFPQQDQLSVMKGIMDGKSLSEISKELSIKVKDAKDKFTSGMKLIEAKTLYDLILWGLKTGVIRDKPLNVDFSKLPKYEAQPTWMMVLSLTAAGYNDFDISEFSGLSKDTIKHHREFIAKKFNLGPSLAEYIRFSFKVLNPINPPPYKMPPHKASISPFQTIKDVPMLSKYKPADIDPEIRVYDKSSKIDIGNEPDEKKIKPKFTTKSKLKLPPKASRTTPIQTALYLLGIPKETLLGKGTFWERPSEYHWNLLSLAKRKYELEISHAHPDKGGDPRRASQLNAAWNLTKKLFAKHGYSLNEN